MLMEPYDSDEFDDVQEGDASILIDSLFRAWVNEKGAPELLDYANDAVSQLLDKVVEQEGAVHEMGQDNLTKHFLRHIFQTEIVRIKYLIKAYLRTRQIKIEQHVAYILNEKNNQIPKLSAAELRYAQGYKEISDTLKQTSFLNQLPDRVANPPQGKDESVVAPNDRNYVFCYVEQDLGHLQIDETVTISLSRGNIYVLRYDLIATYLADSSVRLL